MAADSLSVEEKLKLACYYEVSKICKFVCENNTLLGELQIDKQAKQLIAELIWKKLKIYAEDLEAFAKHAKRSTINAEDVKLLVRRNPSMNCLQNEKGEEGNSIPRNGKGMKQNAKDTNPSWRHPILSVTIKERRHLDVKIKMHDKGLSRYFLQIKRQDCAGLFYTKKH
ncbi:centromere protein S-like isoform X1 [Homalodisca vitripennis]|uniref:centromere protein S-like isoform X1 n=1 Tax=Homalodisca vitripennis TaxID=197043 RepID=UPI001EEA2B5A|nr:centromere protein S-like isoform X1 [Homalodisca vitripennis]